MKLIVPSGNERIAPQGAALTAESGGATRAALLAMRARNRKFESTPLQRRVSSKLGSDTSAMEASAEPGTLPLTTPVALTQVGEVVEAGRDRPLCLLRGPNQ